MGVACSVAVAGRVSGPATATSTSPAASDVPMHKMKATETKKQITA